MRGIIGIAVLLLGSGQSWAQQRFDHRGSLGLTIAAGGELLTAIHISSPGERGLRIPLEVGGTLALSEKNELRLAGRVAPGFEQTPGLAGSIYAGLRNSRGMEEWKTFFDLELAVHVTPFVAVGVRGGFGVQYDFSPVVGVYAQLGIQFGGATSLRLSCDAMAGFQFRTYLFD